MTLDYAPAVKASRFRLALLASLPILLAGGIVTLLRGGFFSHLRCCIGPASICSTNLRSIGQALYIYAQDDPELRFPSRLQLLVNADLITSKHLRCPATASQNCGLSDYVVVPGQTERDDPKNVLAFERQPNHREGVRMNVLFVDGHVSLLTQTELTESLAGTFENFASRGVNPAPISELAQTGPPPRGGPSP